MGGGWDSGTRSAGHLVWEHVVAQGLGSHDASLAQVACFHIIDNCVNLGRHPGGFHSGYKHE